MINLTIVKAKENKLHALLLEHGIKDELVRKRIIVEMLEEIFKHG